MQQGRSIFVLMAILLLVLPTFAGEIEIPISLSEDKLIYEDGTGHLFVKSGSVKTRFKRFNLPRNIPGHYLTASADVDKKRNQHILLRHGERASLLNLETGAVELLNFGPVLIPTIPWMAYDPKRGVLIFPNRSLLKTEKSEVGGTTLVLIEKSGSFAELSQMADSKNPRFMRVPAEMTLLRFDRDPQGNPVEISYKVATRHGLKPDLEHGIFGISMTAEKATYFVHGYDFFDGEKGEYFDEKADLSAPFEKLVKMIPDAKWTQIVEGPFLDLYLNPNQVRGLVNQWNLEKSDDPIAKSIRLVPSYAVQSSVAMQSPISPVENQIESIQKRLRSQVQRAEEIRKKLNEALIDQPDAVTAFVNLALRQESERATRAVALLGGTTGTGKTSGFTQFIKAMFPDAEKPVLEIDMSQMRTPEFFAAELFGSGPGYIGGDAVTKLMVWLLKNAEGGGLLFDEIDKTDARVLQILQTFIEKGVIVVRPDVVPAVLQMYRDVPVGKWPAVLRQETKDGKQPNTSFELKLTSKHFIALATNAGAEVFTGTGSSSVAGQRLASDQEIDLANSQFTAEKIKTGLRARGFSDDFIARIKDIVPFKVLKRESFKKIYDQKFERLRESIKAEFAVSISFSKDFSSNFSSLFYDALQGARLVDQNVDRWIGDRLNQLIVYEKIPVGSEVKIGFVPAAKNSNAQLTFSTPGQNKIRFEIGGPRELGPVELLKRAEDRLWPAMQENIFGHEAELRLVYQNILAQLIRAVKNPEVSARPFILYLDGTSGIGKTEVAKVIASVLFENPKALKIIKMNEINGPSSFEKQFVLPLTQSIRTNPNYLVALIDELPRAGSSHLEAREVIHNNLLGILEEGVLPPISGEYRRVNGWPVEVAEPTTLPKVTFFIATGNLVLEAIPNAIELTRDELSEAVRNVSRDPREFDRIYEANFGSALRGRLGEPVVLSPLTIYEIEKVIDKFWYEQTQTLRNDGYTFELDPGAREILIAMAPPTLGSRPFAKNMLRGITNPLVVTTYLEKLKPGSWTVKAVQNDGMVQFILHNGQKSFKLSEQRAPLLSWPRKRQMGFIQNSPLRPQTCSGLFQ